MTFPANGENVKLGKGSLMLALFDDEGNENGLSFMGNCSAVSISSNIQTAELFSSTERTAALIARSKTRTSFTLSATLNEYAKENLRLFLLGEENTKSQTSGTNVAKSLTNVLKGKYYETGHRKITNVTVNRDTDVLVLNVDYEVNSEFGIIHIRPSSITVVDGDDIVVEYDKPVASIQQIRIGKQSSQLARLVYLADDSNQDNVSARDRLEVWKVDVAPEGDLNLVSDDYGSFNLTMAVLADNVNHPAEPYGTLDRI